MADFSQNGTNYGNDNSGASGNGAYVNVAQYLNRANNAQAAGAAQIQGENDAIGSVNNSLDETRSLTYPFVQQGAAASNQIMANAQNYEQAGVQGLNTLSQQTQPLNVSSYLDPSMQFSMDQGQQALQASAAARGGVLSGAALKDIASYSAGLASQNYQNAFQNATADRSQQLQVGQALTNAGQEGQANLSGVMSNGTNALHDTVGANNAASNDLASLYQNRGTAGANAAASGSNGNPRGAVVGAIGAAALGLPPGVGAVVGSAVSNTVKKLFSDERVKTDIQDTGAAPRGALMKHLFGDTSAKAPTENTSEVKQTLDALNPKTFSYTQEAQQKLGAPSGRNIGIIAQDLEKTPAGNLVTPDENGVKTIDIPKATNFALAALAELNKRLDAVERKK